MANTYVKQLPPPTPNFYKNNVSNALSKDSKANNSSPTIDYAVSAKLKQEFQSNVVNQKRK